MLEMLGNVMKHAAVQSIADAIESSMFRSMAQQAAAMGITTATARHCRFPETEEEYVFMEMTNSTIIVAVRAMEEGKELDAFYNSLEMTKRER